MVKGYSAMTMERISLLTSITEARNILTYNFKDMWTLLTDFSIDLEKAKRGEI